MDESVVVVNINNDHHLLQGSEQQQHDEIPSTHSSHSTISSGELSNIQIGSINIANNNKTIHQPPEDKQATLLFEQQCCIEWRNITFPFDKKNKKKPFLQNIYGFAKPGSITAICGPSSSGKSLLLRVLAMRESALSNSFAGDILLNGEVVMNSEKQLYKSTTNKYRALVSLVSKEYYAPYFNSFTVKEILEYAIKLRLPMHPKSHKVWSNRKERFELLLDCYRLKEVQNKFYPSLSGGERRRLTIAVQNVFYHRVVLLEEPTDDLEFAESFLLVQSLKRVACFGVSIVMTIHKPSIREISLFDYVCLLDKGEQIYFGKIDMLNQYFNNILEIPLPMKTQNIVSNVLELLLFHKLLKNGNEKDLLLLSEFIPHDSEEVSLKKDNLANEFKARLDTFYKPQASEILATYSHNKVENIQTEKYHSNYFYTILILIDRAFRLKKRNWKLDILSPILENLLISIGIGLIYFQLEPTDMYYRSRVFSFLNISISLTFGLTLKTFIAQLPGMQQERRSAFYPMSAYYISRTVVNTVTYTIFPLIYGLVVYFMVGLYLSAGRIFMFMFIFVMYHLTCQSFAEFLVCFFPIPYVLAFMSSVLNMFTIFASGSFGKNRIFETPYTQWISYLSYVFYGFRCLMINEFAEVYYSNKTGTIPPTHFTNGSYFLETVYGIEGSYSTLWIYVSCLIAIMFLCRIFAYFGLRFIIGKKSPRRFIRRVFKCCCERAG